MSKEALTLGGSINGVPVQVRQPIDGMSGVVIVLHQAPGITPPIVEWLDFLADSGYVAIAPNLHHRRKVDFINPMEFGGDMDAFSAVLPTDADLNEDFSAILEGLADLGVKPRSIAVIGFSYGARAAYLLATTMALGAAVSWYPVGVHVESFDGNAGLPALAALQTPPSTPWLGLVGDEDFMLAPGESELWQASIESLGSGEVTLVRYPTASHGFDAHNAMGPGMPDTFNAEAREDGVARTMAMLSRIAH
jgi:carboxymethylenebutenolidase